jgi:hypothetical protein
MAILLMSIVLVMLTAISAFGWPGHRGVYVVLFCLALVALILLCLSYSSVAMPPLYFHR